MIDEWQEYLETQKLSKRTIKEYTNYLYKLPKEVNPETLSRFVHQNNNNVARAFIKKFIEFGIDKGYFVGEEAAELRIYKIPKIRGRTKKRQVTILNRGQVEELAGKVKSRLLRLMILTTFYLGLRRQELVGLKFNNINWESKVVKISYEIAKGKKERVIDVPDRLYEEFIDYFDSLPAEVVKVAFENNMELFPKSAIWFSKKLSQCSEDILGFKLNPHALRHSCATYLKQQGLDLQEIAQILGHSNITTTERYAHLDRKSLSDKFIQAFQE